MASFFDPYRHEFVRVGACVPHVAVAEPARNADQALGAAARRRRGGIALMVFPELALSAYAIDDLLFQDAVLDAVERADRPADRGKRRPAAGVRRRRAAAPGGAALQLRGGRSTAGGCSGSCRRCSCRITANSTSAGISPRARACAAARSTSAGSEAPFGTRPDVRGRRAARRSRSISRSARTSGCRMPPSARARRRRGGNPAQPVGQQHRDRQGADAAPAVRVAIGALHRRLCLFGRRGRRVDDRSRLGRPGRHLRDRRGAGRDAALQRRTRDRGRRCRSRPHPPGADAHQHVRRQCAGCSASERRRSAASRLTSRRPPSRLDLARRVERFPFVPSDPAMLRDNCYEAYNIQVQGLAQRLKATGLKRLVIGVSGGLDSTQALIVSARVMDRLGLPRSQRPRPIRCPASRPADGQVERLAADARARRHRRRDRHPPGGQADARRYRPRLGHAARRSTT